MGPVGFIDGVFIDSLPLTQRIKPCGQPGDVIVILIDGHSAISLLLMQLNVGSSEGKLPPSINLSLALLVIRKYCEN